MQAPSNVIVPLGTRMGVYRCSYRNFLFMLMLQALDKHFAKCFVYIISFNLYNHNPGSQEFP